MCVCVLRRVTNNKRDKQKVTNTETNIKRRILKLFFKTSSNPRKNCLHDPQKTKTSAIMRASAPEPQRLARVWRPLHDVTSRNVADSLAACDRVWLAGGRRAGAAEASARPSPSRLSDIIIILILLYSVIIIYNHYLREHYDGDDGNSNDYYYNHCCYGHHTVVIILILILIILSLILLIAVIIFIILLISLLSSTILSVTTIPIHDTLLFSYH